jgi:hypothetical protein
MERSRRLIDYYLPPAQGFVLESLVATTYQVDFEFFEEELLAAALGVRSPVSRPKAFRSELERRLQKTEVSVLYDLGGCDRLSRLSPRIDAVPVAARKLHSKISLLMFVREDRTGGAPDRLMRLIVGSANLTRQGFRHNYECVASVDYGGTNQASLSLLTTAIGLVRQIGAESQIPQLSRQLAAFAAQAAPLPAGDGGPDDPIALVAATGVVTAVRDAWTALSDKAPETVRIVSPFWTEGSTAPEALFQLSRQLGAPAHLELICCGETSADGRTWLPVFDSSLAVELKNRLPGRLYLRAALPDAGPQESVPTVGDSGDELEDKEFANRIEDEIRGRTEIRRPLHAKMIIVQGAAGSVLYAGSSNCTRRGLGLGGASNFEAGFVYRLTPRQGKHLSSLLAFAGPATEVHPGCAPSTVQPRAGEETFVPSFLSEIVASGTMVTVRFREKSPADLVMLMPIPARADAGYRLLFRAGVHGHSSALEFSVELAACERCNDRLEPLPPDPSGERIEPNVSVDVRWEGHTATFPVRFDEKTRLPLHLAGRKPTEGELIEYFLFGREPGDWEGEGGLAGQEFKAVGDAPVDTRRILAYFIRRFVQAIPGIEAEVQRASYARASLDAALRGPTSPLELAERAFASLARGPAPDEPAKTPTAVGFQLTEILAALLRCRSHVANPEINECFRPVIDRCREMLNVLVSQQPELQADGFRLYQQRILGDAG